MISSRFRLFLRQFALVCLVALSAAQIAGQTAAQQFANVDWFTRPLGAGVVWKFYQFENLFGAPQSISYVEADLDTPGVKVELPYLNGLQRTSSLIKNQFPSAAAGINGTFFSSGGHKTFLKVKNVVVPRDEVWQGRWAYSGGLVFNRNTGVYDIIRQPTGLPNGNQWWVDNTGSWTDVLVNGPLLLQNSNVTSGQFPSGSHCNRNPRTMVGKKPGNILVLVVADGRHLEAAGLTCDEMAEVMLALGCTDATSLDGGGSSAMYGRGEPNNGILNYPSDDGGYDHDPRDERAVANAIAIMANYTTALPFDARLESVTVPSSINAGQRKFATLTYRNIGTQTWTSDRVTVTTSRPFGRVSQFYDESTWGSPSQAWRLPAGATVPPGGIINISLPLRGPSVPGQQTVTESFQLTLDGAQRFGPADSELKIRTIVFPSAGTFMVEPRTGGINTQWYSDEGFADTGTDCDLGTPNIGMRYGSTYRSVAGLKSAKWFPNFPSRGFYRVHVGWGPGSSRRGPITYHVYHRGGKTTLNLNQSTTSNEWIWLGNREFEFDAGQNQQGVEMTNENIDVSGSMYAGPVSFEYVGASSVKDWSLY